MADDADKPDAGGPRNSTVEWNDVDMQTGFANVVNVQGTREQVELFFGTNRTWSVQTAAEGAPVRVDLTNRIIMTPFAAKRLQQILTGVLREYEARHGALKLDE